MNPAFWSNLVIAHVWGAAVWIKPGWFPASVALISFVMATLILRQEHAEKLREKRAVK